MAKVRLGDVAIERKETSKNNQSFPTVGLEHLIPGEVTLTQWEENTDNTFTKFFRKGDVLFGRRRAYLKKAAVAPMDGICSGDITVISAKPEKINPELLPFIIQNEDFFDFAVEKSAGSLSPRAKWQHLKDYEFNLPDLDEQSRLSELLWAMQDTKRAYQDLLYRTEELVKSQFIEMFGNLDNIPEGWQKIDFGRACNLVNGKAFKPSDWSEEGVPIVRIQNLNDQSAEYNYYKGSIEEKYWIDSGDLLFAWSGTPGTSFGAFIWNGGKAVLNQHIFRVEPNKMIDKWFLMRCFEGKLDEIIEKAHGGVGLRHITKKELEQIEFLLPPMNIQMKFADFCKQSDKSKFELENAIKELTATYKRIISDNLG